MAGALAWLFLVFPLLLCPLVSHAQPSSSPAGRNATTGDEAALLSFKSMLSDGSLASWNATSRYYGWPGVVCHGWRRHPERVVALCLSSHGLSGRVSPSLGNLSFLQELDLGDNHLAGQIPPELGRLSRLRMLNLSVNSLRGSIPVALAGCSSLLTLDVNRNHLQGEIPGWLPNLTSMEYLSLGGNRLSGEISPGLGNLYNLGRLGLSSNALSGAIPSSLGLLSNLSWLSLGYNNLSGVIPDSIWNISSMTFFSVQQNMLSGTIPANAFDNLPSLHSIYMDHNQFHGEIPASIANASDVSVIQLYYNFFDGVVPPELGRLRNLYWLQISANLLRAQEPKDWEFVTSLANCSQLTVMEMGGNKMEGVLPDSLSNLSTSLTYLSFTGNKLSGSVPRDMGNLVNLENLDISNNSFTGTFPSSFSELRNLVGLYVTENKMSGSIPWTIGNLTELNYLDLSENAFSGRLPSTIGNLSKLLALDLSGNSFTGPIPVGLFNISSLSVTLALSHNNLMGSVPQEIGYLKNLVEFHAESNKLTGEIPDTLGECQLLQNLYLQDNILTGGIPTSMSQLKGLENLDLSSNNLTGQIPKFLVNITMLNYLNLSFNGFVGEVPNSGIFANATAIWIQGNEKLCSGIPDLHLPPCSSQVAKKGSFVIPTVVTFAATIVILSLICVFISWRKITTKIPSTTSMQDHQFISYSQLARATNGFSTTNLLGSGAFGTVFKGNIVGGSTRLVAVKVLKLQTPGALKSFIAECEALRNLRHRNLVKIITACSSIDNRGNDFKAIVLDFMPSGSLEDWLHPDAIDQAAKNLNLIERVNILLDVANALDYLHCYGHAPVLHCDLKPSNVLLDAEMVAHVGDFGLAKILVETSSCYQQSTSSMGFRGTIGYAPPECGTGNMISTYADIYSYGILVLETITGKKPTDSKFGEGLSLRQYTELGLHGRAMDIADNRLFGLENELQTEDDHQHKLKTDCVISLLGLGLCCSHEMPSSTMATGDIIKELHAIKKKIFSFREHRI